MSRDPSRRRAIADSSQQVELGDVPDWVGRGAWVLSGALAAAVTLALVVWEPEHYRNAGATRNGGDAETVAPTIVPLSEASVLAGAGEVERGGVALTAGDPLREGDYLTVGAAPACLRFEPSARVCAAAETGLALRSLAFGQRVLEVQRGTVLADVLTQPGDPFALRSSSGVRVRASEARFAMVLPASDALRVLVLEGEAEVVRGVERLELSPGQGVRWSREAGFVRHDVGDGERAALDQLARTGTATEETSTGAADATRGKSPTTARARREPASRRAAQESAGTAASRPPSADDVAGEEAEPVTALDALPAPDAPTEADDSSPGDYAAARAFNEAEVLARSQHHARAERAYADILDRYPESSLARASLVRLGSLRLEHLNDLLGALGSYRAYLAQGPGPLEKQARLGVIATLAKLRRYAHERKAIEEFLEAHPDSPEAEGLRRRLALLGGTE